MKSSARIELANKLMKDEKFLAHTCHADRIGYLLDNVLDFESLLKTVQERAETVRERVSKNEGMAKNYKQEAELYMRNDNLPAALTAVHKALLYAPIPDDSIRSKLYAIKARIHFEQQNYPGTLYSLDLTKRGGSDFLPDLDLYMLKLNCLMKLLQYDAAAALVDEIVQQSDLLPQRSDLSVQHLLAFKQSFQASCQQAKYSVRAKKKFYSYRLDPRCKVMHSPTVGRYFMAVDDIPPDTVLLEERPYSVVMETDFWHRKCSTCLLDLKHKFYPCAFCAELVFCDEQCFKEAWATFHRYECGLVCLLRNVTSPAFHVFRIISRVGLHEALRLQDMKTNYSIEQYLADNDPPQNVPESEKSAEQRHRDYLMACILCDHNAKHSPSTNAYHLIVALELAALLQLAHNFRSIYSSQEFLVHLVEMLMVDVRRIIFNVFGWHEYNEDWTFRGHVANCQCQVGSLINHSCVANTNWQWKDGLITFTTKRAIPKGTEITITYGPSKEMTYYRRQERLNHYFFACKCAACFADALHGDNLRCTTCNGPVVFGSALNKEKQLNGKCLVCYTLQPNFERSIEEIAQIKERVRVMGNLILIMPTNVALLERAIQLVKRLLELSLRESEAVCGVALDCSHIIEHFDLDSIYNLDRRIELALLFDRALPCQLAPHQISHKSIASCQFWFEMCADFWPFLATFSPLQTMMGEHGPHPMVDPKLVWDAQLHFHERLHSALRDLVRGEPSKYVLTITGALESRLDEMLQQCRMAYSKQATFTSPQLTSFMR